MNTPDSTDKGFPAPLEQIRVELEQIRPHLEELTHLTSRWNGNVILVANAPFKGLKPYGCDIRIGDQFVASAERWTTLIHELLHACSVGYNRMDFENNVGWEEGVVEKMQRLLRGQVYGKIGVEVDSELLERLDSGHPFNRYIEALERVRALMEVDEHSFYLKLLQTPLKERYSSLLKQVMQFSASSRIDALKTLSSANVLLQQGRKEGL